MTLGLSRAGFPPDHLFELNKHCCATLRHNATGETPLVVGKIHEEDVGKVDWESTIQHPVRLLSAGPPCQPFSLAGKHLADQDERNEFPSTLRAIRALRPAAILIENVHGLNRASFRPYLEYILRQIRYPSVNPVSGELWQTHDARIRAAEDSSESPEYTTTWGLVNSADYGIPQMRSRIIILATRSEFAPPVLPAPTHSKSALVRCQDDGSYWKRHNLRRPENRQYPKGPPGYVRDPAVERLPWLTVRDGLAGLPTPPPAEDIHKMNHWFIPGARLYKKHTGCDPDWPSKTIKAGVHGVAGGENIIRLEQGRFRYYTLREMARLQGIDDRFYFTGPRSRIVGQIGNAVPARLARVLAEALKPNLAAYEPELATGTPPQGAE